MTRYRFTRAYLAAGFAFGLIGGWPFIPDIAKGLTEQLAFVGAPDFAAMQGSRRLLILSILYVALGAAILIASSLFVTAWERLHRRAAGVLVGLFCSMYAIIALGAAAVAVVGAAELVPIAVRSSNSQLWEPIAVNTALVLAMGLIGWAYLECSIYLVWTVFARRDSFFAVRGWRPPVWHLAANFSRQVGAPAFLAAISRDRSVLTFISVGLASLNTWFYLVILAPTFATIAFAGGEFNGDFVPLEITAAAVFLGNLLGGGVLLSALLRRRVIAAYQNVREWDPRRPILVLRSFSQDRIRLPAPTLSPLLHLPAGLGRQREIDEILLEVASPYGPVIAIGSPSDPLPPLGAARIFVRGESARWEDVVRDLIGAAKAVIFFPGQSPGVAWEQDQLRMLQAETKTLYIASPELDNEANLSLFRALSPEVSSATYRRGQAPIAAFRGMGSDWSVCSARRRSVQTYTVALNAGLQAMFGIGGVSLRDSIA